MGLEAVSQMLMKSCIQKMNALIECLIATYIRDHLSVQGIYLPCSQITAVHYIKEHVHVISSHRSPILLHVSLTKFITLICY